VYVGGGCGFGVETTRRKEEETASGSDHLAIRYVFQFARCCCFIEKLQIDDEEKRSVSAGVVPDDFCPGNF
jgi:hypothetical protein